MSTASLVRAARLPALLAVLYAVLLLGAVRENLGLVAVAGVGVHLLAALTHLRLVRALPQQRLLLVGEQHAAVLLGDALVLVFLVRSDQLSDRAQAVVVLALVLHQAARVAHSLLAVADSRLRLRRPELHNVPSPVRTPAPPALLGARGQQLVAHAGVLLPAALALAGLTGRREELVVLAALATVLLGMSVVLSVAPSVVRLARLPRRARLLRTVQAAVDELEPAVVLYSPGQPGAYHWVRPWLDTLEHLGRPAMIMFRYAASVPALGPTCVPIVCLPDGADVRELRLPAGCVALYVANAAENLPLIKNPDLRSAFIGHGDSDKATSASPASKVYDEVWVAGESGRERYVRAGVGVRSEDVRVVGRPQVRRVQPARPRGAGEPFTVLYAPTWEGPSNDPAVSSLLHSGVAIVRTLLACEGVRVLFRPHPATGNVQPACAEVSRQVAALLAAAGPQHAVVAPRTTDLYDCFNDADAMVADLSGVVSDFLASDKPYFIVNGSALSDDEFREQNPSSGGAYLVGRGAAGLLAGLEDARGPDTLRQRRREVRAWTIGPPTSDPVGLFAEAVDALGAKDRAVVV